MAELDYAFLADFAKVEPNGTLTAVGASWTHLVSPELPAAHRMAVAGRIRAEIDEGAVGLRIDVHGPDGVFKLAAGSELVPGVASRPYGAGLVGLLFALDLQIPLPIAGMYTIYIEINGEQARRLAFEVTKASEGA